MCHRQLSGFVVSYWSQKLDGREGPTQREIQPFRRLHQTEGARRDRSRIPTGNELTHVSNIGHRV